MWRLTIIWSWHVMIHNFGRQDNRSKISAIAFFRNNSVVHFVQVELTHWRLQPLSRLSSSRSSSNSNAHRSYNHSQFSQSIFNLRRNRKSLSDTSPKPRTLRKNQSEETQTKTKWKKNLIQNKTQSLFQHCQRLERQPRNHHLPKVIK